MGTHPRTRVPLRGCGRCGRGRGVPNPLRDPAYSEAAAGEQWDPAIYTGVFVSGVVSFQRLRLRRLSLWPAAKGSPVIASQPGLFPGVFGFGRLCSRRL